ncbi:MAG: hypothetical protein LBD77_02170 [Bifidobacteriaceae bacterium]|jgi:hypothetical protein|nr:hypothetical protein [Bifidobacteriaceae bacterium]
MAVTPLGVRTATGLYGEPNEVTAAQLAAVVARLPDEAKFAGSASSGQLLAEHRMNSALRLRLTAQSSGYVAVAVANVSSAAHQVSWQSQRNYQASVTRSDRDRSALAAGATAAINENFGYPGGSSNAQNWTQQEIWDHTEPTVALWEILGAVRFNGAADLADLRILSRMTARPIP